MSSKLSMGPHVPDVMGQITNYGREKCHQLPHSIVTPIVIEQLEFFFRNHPSPSAVSYVLSGFRWGFDIGYTGSFTNLNTRPRNLLSARSNPKLVLAAIKKELDRGHTAGPFTVPPFPNTHCSPLGTAPKPDGSVRLILDLSSPRGEAVNEGIDQNEFSCTYSNFDEAVSLVRRLGCGAWMAKADIKHAFRLCPVAPSQWHLLCFS